MHHGRPTFRWHSRARNDVRFALETARAADTVDETGVRKIFCVGNFTQYRITSDFFISRGGTVIEKTEHLDSFAMGRESFNGLGNVDAIATDSEDDDFFSAHGRVWERNRSEVMSPISLRAHVQ